MLAKLRYRLMFMLMRYITPTMHNRIQELDLKGEGINIPSVNIVNKFPRPAISFMKKYFKNKSLNGAEIGVNRGDNAKSILKTLKIKRLFLIDIWDDCKDYNYNYTQVFNLDLAYKRVLKRFKGNEKVIIIKALSEIAVKQFKDNSLDFVYIDANHEYSFVYQDIDLWYPKIKQGGIISGHDVSNWKDVFKAVKDWCLKHNIKFHVDAPDWYFIKRPLICGKCGWYNNDTKRCEGENIPLNPNSKNCICFMPRKLVREEKNKLIGEYSKTYLEVS